MQKLPLEYQIVTKTYLKPSNLPTCTLLTVVTVVTIVSVVTVVTVVTRVTRVTIVTIVTKIIFTKKKNLVYVRKTHFN